MRNILLIEPGYKNKYPPIGLMKIATYHRILGDSVTFFKGDPMEFILSKIVGECVSQLNSLGLEVAWLSMRAEIKSFINTGRKALLESLIADCGDASQSARLWLNHFSQYYRRKEFASCPEYDRIYVTTLFTFYWDITIKAIQSAKLLVRDQNELKVGGVLASLLSDELQSVTGIRPETGLLDRPGILDDNEIVVDDLPLDYSILDEIDYEYPTGSAYFTFMTKGCTRTCSFCSVPKLEPIYREKIPTVDKFKTINNLYGEQQHLLLMDNNVLASPKFPEIIQEIKAMAFSKGSHFVEPNQLEIAVNNLRLGINDVAYLRRTFKLIEHFRLRRLKGETLAGFNRVMEVHGILRRECYSKENVLSFYEDIKDLYEKHRYKKPRARYVDFNQGTDARYVTEENMRLLSEIPIYPLRIAFDHISLTETYSNAVRLAAKYGINRLSNYLLFNFNDQPQDLYERMKLNIELSEELGIEIYSFPMKYIPLFGEEAKHRSYVGKHWRPKFIRTIQCISNATRGIVPSGRAFFEKAFGRNVKEYMQLLYMPEQYVIYRKKFEEERGKADEWRYLFTSGYLSSEELSEATAIIASNDFSNLDEKTSNRKIVRLLKHYVPIPAGLKDLADEQAETRRNFDSLIESDKFIDLTLTYDYESATSSAH